MASERSSKVAETIDQAVQSLFLTLSSSYGPKGLDKMLIKGKDTVITNDGATIMGFYKTHPIHRILSDVSSTQDMNCGDGTTSVVLLVGCIMEHIRRLRSSGVHPSKIVEALDIAKKLALKYVEEVKVKIGESEFLSVALTTLNSKIASKSMKMAQIAISALSQTEKDNIRVVKKVGGNIDDIQLFDGLLLNRTANIINDSSKKKVLVIQFCISSPKTNLDSKIIINDHSLMERFVKEEREYVIGLIKKIRSSGATLLIIQKSIVRESCSELALYFLKKIGISVVDGVERKDIEFICRCLKTSPVSDPDLPMVPVDVDTESVMDGEWINLKGVGSTVLVSGCDDLVLAEAERSLNDVLCVVKCLLDEPFIVAGGGSVEIGVSALLDGYTGPYSLIMKEIAAGFAGMPHLLAQNAGLSVIEVISNLKKNIGLNRHLGISLRTGFVADMVNDDGVIQPAAVTRSMIALAIETVRMLVRVDDILPSNH